MRKVLIIGGLGYIGGRLADYLVSLGKFDVTVTTHRNILALDLSTHLAKVIQLNLEISTEDISDVLKSYDCIVYLAALNAQQSKCASSAYRVNTIYVDKVLQACSRCPTKKFIYLSTAHVYGAALEGEVTESTVPKPLSNYAITHLAAEYHTLNAHYSRQVDSVVLRLSNSFGPPSDCHANCWMLLLNDLARSIVTTGLCQLRSSGVQLRDFVPMADVVNTIVFFISNSVNDSYPVFNVGSGQSISVRSMVLKLIEQARMMGYQVTLDAPPEEGGHGQFVYSIEKMAGLCGRSLGDFSSELESLLRFCEKHKKVVA